MVAAPRHRHPTPSPTLAGRQPTQRGRQEARRRNQPPHVGCDCLPEPLLATSTEDQPTDRQKDDTPPWPAPGGPSTPTAADPPPRPGPHHTPADPKRSVALGEPWSRSPTPSLRSTRPPTAFSTPSSRGGKHRSPSCRQSTRRVNPPTEQTSHLPSTGTRPDQHQPVLSHRENRCVVAEDDPASENLDVYDTRTGRWHPAIGEIGLPDVGVP